MNEANAFDKRNQSIAEIMMSVDDSDMIVDINSLKDEKEIPEVSQNSIYNENSITTSKRKIQSKKVTPD